MDRGRNDHRPVGTSVAGNGDRIIGINRVAKNHILNGGEAIRIGRFEPKVISCDMIRGCHISDYVRSNVRRLEFPCEVPIALLVYLNGQKHSKPLKIIGPVGSYTV